MPSSSFLQQQILLLTLDGVDADESRVEADLTLDNTGANDPAGLVGGHDEMGTATREDADGADGHSHEQTDAGEDDAAPGPDSIAGPSPPSASSSDNSPQPEKLLHLLLPSERKSLYVKSRYPDVALQRRSRRGALPNDIRAALTIKLTRDMGARMLVLLEEIRDVVLQIQANVFDGDGRAM